MISDEHTEQILLSAANEDYTGLYELIWELNSLFPDASVGEKYGAAERAARKLLDLGWIRLYQNDLKLERFEELDPTSAKDALSDPTSWYPVKSWTSESEGVRIVLAITEAGEQAYLKGTTGE
jgi:hypothetical protein